MNNDKKYQIALWGFVGFAALALGVGAYVFVLHSGADQTVAVVALFGMTLVALA